MLIATFQGERTLSEIADKLFKRLTPRQREKIEAAILRANPQLRDLQQMEKGAILRVPDLPEFRAKTSETPKNPETDIVKDLSSSLDSFSKHMAQQFETALKDTRAQSKLLKSARFKKEIANAPNIQALAGEAAKVLEAQTRQLAEQQKKVKNAIGQALQDLEAK